MEDRLAQRFAIPDHVVFREVDGDAVLLNLQTGVYFGLDAIGTRVWRALVEAGSVGSVLPALLEEFDVTRQVLEADVTRLLAELTDRGLIATHA